MNNDKTCFADVGNTCTALAGKHCDNCKFYRDDVYNSKIESDIRLYASLRSSELSGKE